MVISWVIFTLRAMPPGATCFHLGGGNTVLDGIVPGRNTYSRAFRYRGRRVPAAQRPCNGFNV